MKKLSAKETLQRLISVGNKERWKLFCKLVESNKLTKKAFNVGLKDAYTTGVYDYRAQDYFAISDKNLMMDKAEIKYYNHLPEVVTLYRGASYREFDEEWRESNFGLSWTTERKVAEFFAFRGKGCSIKDGRVYKIEIKKEAISAVFLERGEYECILTQQSGLDYFAFDDAVIVTDKPTIYYQQYLEEKTI